MEKIENTCELASPGNDESINIQTIQAVYYVRDGEIQKNTNMTNTSMKKSQTMIHMTTINDADLLLKVTLVHKV